MIDYVEFRLITPVGQVALPDFTNATFDVKYNEMGVIDFAYPSDKAKGLGLKDQATIAAIVGFNSGASKEVERYVIDQTSDEVVVDGAPTKTFNGTAVLSLLNDARVYPSNWPGKIPSGHEFVEQSLGTIFRTLLLRARNRGTLTGVADTSFTGTTDSLGAPWTHLHSQTYENGKQYLSIAQELAEKGLLDIWTETVGGVTHLRLANGGTRGAQVAQGTVEIRPAKNVSDLTIATQSTESSSVMLVEGEEGALVEVSDPAFQTQLGRRRENYLAQPGIAPEFTDLLTELGNRALSMSARIPTEETVGVSNSSDLTPFRDFNVADWIHTRYNSDDESSTRRVRQIAISVDAGRKITVALTLGQFLYESDVALSRILEAYTGSGGAILNNGVDNTVPNPPNSLTTTTLAYLTSTGAVQSSFVANWNAPTTNVGGSAYTDDDGYIVNWRYTVGGPSTAWRGETRTQTTSFVVANLIPGATVEISVKAVDKTNHASVAATTTRVLAVDATPPPTPAAPTGASRLGNVQITWSGLTATGVAMPKDFAYAELHELTNNTTVPLLGAATKVGSFSSASPGSLSLSNVAYNVTRYYRVIAVDTSGNASTASAASNPVTVTPLVDTDLIGEVLSGVHMKPGTVTMKHLAIGDFENAFSDFSLEAVRGVNLPPNAGSSYFRNTADPNSVWQAIIAPTGNTANLNWTMGAPIAVVEGDEFWVTFGAARMSANFSISVGFRVLNAAGSVISTASSAQNGLTTSTGIPTGLWADTYNQKLVVPANAAFIVPEIVANTLGVSALTGTWWVRRPVLRRRNIGSLMVDGTITGTQIQSLSIDTGHLAANSVTSMKVRAGEITADKLSISAKGFAVNDNSNMEELALDLYGNTLTYPAQWSAQFLPNSTVLSSTTSNPISGSRSALLSTTAASGGYLWYLPKNAVYIPVVAGEKWTVSVKVRLLSGSGWNYSQSFGVRPTVAGVTFPSTVTHGYSNTAGSQFAGTALTDLSASGTTYTLTSTFTVPYGHSKLGMYFWTGVWDNAATWVVDEFTAHPAIDDTKITDISPGKITTGTLAANTRIIAGNESGARVEMNASGIFAYDSSANLSFFVSGYSGDVYMRGSITTGSASGSVQISAASNPYQGNSSWGAIQFYSDNASWFPGLVWAAYGSNWGNLQLAGPRLSTSHTPARVMLQTSTNGTTQIQVETKSFYATAENFWWGDPANGVVNFRLRYSDTSNPNQRFVFNNAGTKGFEVRFETLGSVVLAAKESDSVLNQMSFRANDFRFYVPSMTHDLMIWAATNASYRPTIFGVSLNIGIVFGNDAIHIKTPTGSSFMEIKASAFTVSSDVTTKENISYVSPEESPLDVVSSIPVYNYDLKQEEGRRGHKHMGMLAHEVAEILPGAVFSSEDSDTDTLDLYHLISVLWAGVQELKFEVETLKSSG